MKPLVYQSHSAKMDTKEIKNIKDEIYSARKYLYDLINTLNNFEKKLEDELQLKS